MAIKVSQAKGDVICGKTEADQEPCIVSPMRANLGARLARTVASLCGRSSSGLKSTASSGAILERPQPRLFERQLGKAADLYPLQSKFGQGSDDCLAN